MRRAPLVSGLLVLLAFGQLGLRLRRNPPALSGPVRGDTLPLVLVETLEGGRQETLVSLTLESDGCDVVFLMSAYCPHSARMRHTWADAYRTWVDSVGQKVAAIWVVGEDRTVAAHFVDGFDLAGARITTLSVGGADSWSQLGAVGTPMAYLVNPAGVVQEGVMGQRFPAASLTRAACSGR